jgi:hypothetical protein
VCGNVRDNHFFGIDVFVLESCVFHCTLNDLDDSAGGLHWVSTRSNSTLAVSNHRGARSSLALVATSQSIWNCCCLAAYVSTVRIDLENFVEESNSFSGSLVLDSPTDLKAMLHVHVHVRGTGRSKSVALQQLCVSSL